MNYLSNKQGFLGVDNKFNIKEKVIIIPFGLEKTVSYGGGTRNGPKEIIITHKDGVLVYADNQIFEEPFKLEKIIGRSGRGDTCGASYVYMRLTSDPGESTKWAAATTSLKMESDTPLKRTKHEIEDRVNEYK